LEQLALFAIPRASLEDENVDDDADENSSANKGDQISNASTGEVSREGGAFEVFEWHVETSEERLAEAPLSEQKYEVADISQQIHGQKQGVSSEPSSGEHLKRDPRLENQLGDRSLPGRIIWN